MTRYFTIEVSSDSTYKPHEAYAEHMLAKACNIKGLEKAGKVIYSLEDILLLSKSKMTHEKLQKMSEKSKNQTVKLTRYSNTKAYYARLITQNELIALENLDKLQKELKATRDTIDSLIPEDLKQKEKELEKMIKTMREKL